MPAGRSAKARRNPVSSSRSITGTPPSRHRASFYTGDKFPAWRGNAFVGALKFKLLVRLTMEGDRVVAEERLLQDLDERIRAVVQGPDGYLYLLTDNDDGRILRLAPAS
jgi:glucose/arabinose dehydrogenase